MPCADMFMEQYHKKAVVPSVAFVYSLAGDADGNLCLHAALEDAAPVAEIVLDTTHVAPVVPVAKRQKRDHGDDGKTELEKDLEKIIEEDGIPDPECPKAL